MRTKFLYFCIASFCVIFSCNSPVDKQRLINHVDPFIGTSREGNQIPGPKYPFGMIHPSPVNIGKNSPHATSYQFGMEDIFGFSLTNMVGVGCANYGSILLKPSIEDLDFENYSTPYSNEKANVGYYSVITTKHNIEAEITASARSAIYRFHYPSGRANLMVDLSRRNDKDSSFYVRLVSGNEIEGFKSDGQFCAAGKDIHHKVYFVLQFNLLADYSGVKNGGTIDSLPREARGEDIGSYFSYDFQKATTLEVRAGASYVSMENARLNLKTELEGKSFETVRAETENAWEQLLSRIKVEGGSKDQTTKFYTALYHTMSHPNVLNDVNGQYPSMGSHVTREVEHGKSRYTLFSLWDTYRTLHPFFTLVYPEIQDEMCQSMMGMYKENGWLPQWELVGRETHVMLGDPATIVLADSYLKGILFDEPEAILGAMINNAENYYLAPQWGYDDVAHIRRAIVPYNKHRGWIPYDYKQDSDRIWATVATTQEYNLADWNISQMASDMSKPDTAKFYLERSMGYKNLYNPATMFFQQRWANGNWVEPFNPFAGRWPPQSKEDEVYDMPWAYSGGPGYCEGMAWHYNFFVPHDIKGVIGLMGGEKAFIDRLQMLFDSAYYEPTNEPDIAFPFLFNHVKGEEWRTQKIVKHLIDTEFGIGTGGIPGNDDTGTMSAWLLFAMMGFYPDCPGDLHYQLCTPTFKKVSIQLHPKYHEGEVFTITSGVPHGDFRLKTIRINGKLHDGFRINHRDIIAGGTLHFE